MNERQNKIFGILSKSPSVSVKELSLDFGVSEVTIRKDLTVLEQEGLLKRTHGGAVQMASDSVETRMLFRYEEKLRIATEAAKLVEDGEIVLIEAGSTNAVLAKQLLQKNKVHVITNSLYIASLLSPHKHIKVTLLGGELQEEAQALVGPLTTLGLSKIAVKKAFIGMDGFSEKLGFTCGDFLRAEVGKEMCKVAEEVIVLAESSKFDNVGMTSVVELTGVGKVITDEGISKEKLEILKSNEIETILV